MIRTVASHYCTDAVLYSNILEEYYSIRGVGRVVYIVSVLVYLALLYANSQR